MIGFRSCLHSSLLSLFTVAYKSRCSLPLLISVGFMLLDLHMRLELEIEAHVQPDPTETENNNTADNIEENEDANN